MKDKSLALLLQSGRDSLRDCLQELQAAVERLDDCDREGLDAPIPPADLERAYTLCQGAMRVLDNLARRVGSPS